LRSTAAPSLRDPIPARSAATTPPASTESRARSPQLSFIHAPALPLDLARHCRSLHHGTPGRITPAVPTIAIRCASFVQFWLHFLPKILTTFRCPFDSKFLQHPPITPRSLPSIFDDFWSPTFDRSF
jgi:hypothetical protein